MTSSVFIITLAILLCVSIKVQGQSQLYVNGVIGCQTSSGHHGKCGNLGTSGNPALSCEHVKDVCASEAKSGFYFIESAGLYRKVFCEMDIEGGGWARYGRSNQGTTWNYVDEDATGITLDIINESEVKEMIDLKYNRFLVQTDVVFKMQADDSVNPSRLTTRTLPWLEDSSLFIPDFGNDHTRIEFPTDSVDRVTCIPGSSSKCGQGGGLPSANRLSKEFFFQSLFFSPRGTGASAHGDQWSRNKYTWNGSYYFVKPKPANLSPRPAFSTRRPKSAHASSTSMSTSSSFSSASGSPTSSPRSKQETTDQPVKPNRGHPHISPLSLKTVNQITQFITSAAASSSISGSSTRKNVLPDAVTLPPVLDSSGRLRVHRRRDDSMRLARQAVNSDHNEWMDNNNRPNGKMKAKSNVGFAEV